MASVKIQPVIMPALQHVIDTIASMTPEEFKLSLVRAGIIDKRGRLTKPYRDVGIRSEFDEGFDNCN